MEHFRNDSTTEDKYGKRESTHIWDLGPMKIGMKLVRFSSNQPLEISGHRA
jgi:hypothetical protein